MGSLTYILVLLIWQIESQPTPQGERPSTTTPAIQEKQTGGLTPLKPAPGTTVEGRLYLTPSDDAPVLRQVDPTDRVLYLRTQGHWYEVDLRTAEGLEFRGWLKGSMPKERELPPPIEKAKQPERIERDPFQVKGFTWFWSAEAKRYGALSIGTGGQNIVYKLKGDVTTNGTTSQQAIRPGYNFFGWHLFFKPEFIPFTTTLFQKPLTPTLRGIYEFGLHRVSFSNPFIEEPGVAGKGYTIMTNLYAIDGLARWRAHSYSQGYIEPGIGVGFYYYEVSPDLDPVPSVAGAVNPGQVIFADTTFSALSIPLEAKFLWKDVYYIVPSIRLFLLPSFGSSATGTPDLEASSFPMSLEITGGYRFAEQLALEFETRYFAVSAKGSATSSRRLGVTYTNGKVDISYLKATLGLRWEL